MLALAIFLAFRFSPWPMAFVITRVFASGEAESEARLARHVPPGIETQRDLAYGPGPDDRLDLSRPVDAAGPLPVIVWVHGGAWIAGSKDGVYNYLRVLAGEGYATVAVEYSTGYGSRYPTPVQQVNAALAYLAQHAEKLGLDTGRLVLAGDSAGAQIAAQVALLATDPAYAAALGIAPDFDPAMLNGVLLLSGAYDIANVDMDGDMGWFVKTVLWAYSGVRDFMEDERFLLMAVTPRVTAAFPPAFIASGNGDPLSPQAVKLAARLRDLGVRVETLFFPKGYEPAQPHEFQFNLDSAEGRQATDAMMRFVGEVVRR